MNTLALLCIIYDFRSVIYHIRYFCLKHTSTIHLRVSSYIPFNRLCLFNCLYIAFYLICLYLPHVTSYSTNRMWYPFLKLSHLTLVSQAYLTRVKSSYCLPHVTSLSHQSHVVSVFWTYFALLSIIFYIRSILNIYDTHVLTHIAALYSNSCLENTSHKLRHYNACRKNSKYA